MDITARFSSEAVLVIANTRHGPGGHYHARAHADEPMHDHLVDPDDARRFIADHQVDVPPGPPDAATLDWLRLIRRHARELAGDPGEPETTSLAGWTAATVDATTTEAAIADLFARHELRLQPDGSLLSVLRADGWDGFVAELLPPLVSVRRDRDRLRLCGNPLCRFMFLDRSRNGSRLWCEAATCGNRVRGHRHRLRQATLLPRLATI